MKLQNISLLSVYLWNAFLFTAIAQDDIPSLVKKCQPGIVEIITYNADGEALIQGTGFFVNKKGDLVSSRHVFEGAVKAVIKGSDFKEYPITKILAEDKIGDLILVSANIPKELVLSLKISTVIPQVGEKVVVIGNPAGLAQTVSDGIVSAIRDIPDFGSIIQITAPISSGSSGSPVLTLNGNVIGVATLMVTEGQNLNFAIPSSRVEKLSPDILKNLSRVDEIREALSEPRNTFLRPIKSLTKTDSLRMSALSAYWDCKEGDRYFVNEQFGKAITYYQRAKTNYPSCLEAYCQLSLCFAQLGKCKEAIEQSKMAILIDSNYADAYNSLAHAYFCAKEYSRSIAAHIQVIRIKPDSSNSYISLGNLFKFLKRYPDAIDAYKQAIRLKPDDKWVHYYIGDAYMVTNKYNEAVLSYKQSIRIDTDFSLPHFRLGTTYLSMNDKGSALDEYKILKNLDKDEANKLFNMIYK